MKYNKRLIPVFLLTIIFVPSLLMASSLGSDIRANPVVLNPPLGPAGVRWTYNPQPIVIDIGYGWTRTFEADGSSEIAYSQDNSTDTGSSQEADTESSVAYSCSMGPFISPQPSSTQTASSIPGTSSVKYLLPPRSKKSKAQVRCQTRYDPTTGKWVVRYVMVFVMESPDVKVQKMTKSGVIAYVNIDKKGRGIDVMQ